MSFITSPNMGLPIPAVGSEPGPNYATDVNNSLTIVDGHTHLPGSGVQITPGAININSSLTFNSNSATLLASLTFVPTSQTSLNTVYESSAGDLHYINAAGLDIQITNSSGVAVTPTSIPGLVPPASAQYVPLSSTFIWQSNTNIAANMDFGAAIMRNLSPNSTYALTLQPPAALSSNFTITLPSIPGSTSFLTLDTSGNISGSIATSLGITAANIANATITGGKIASATITGSNIASSTITGSNIASATITGSNIASTTVAPSNLTVINSGTAVLSGSFSTASTSLVFVSPLAVTLSSVVPNRPVYICFQGGVAYCTNSAGLAENAVFTIRAYNGSSYTNLVSFSLIVFPSGTASILMGGLNCVDLSGGAAGTQYSLWVNTNSVQVGINFSGTIVMQVFQ